VRWETRKKEREKEIKEKEIREGRRIYPCNVFKSILNAIQQ
jgi:hypothetical protein